MSNYNEALQQNNTELQSNNTDLQGLLTTINALPDYVEAKPEQTKIATPTTSQQTVTPDDGYTLSSVTVNAMPTATQATPSISVSTGGLITASAQQSAGYVSAGTKSATKQLTTQAAKTITPSTSSQTAVASDRYTTGAVTVAAVPTQTKTATPSAASQDITPDSGKFLSKVTVGGDSNLVAGNIKSGVSIFGVAGSYEGSGGGTGGGVETCSLTWVGGPTTVYYTSIDADGKPYATTAVSSGHLMPMIMIDNIVCGSCFVSDLLADNNSTPNGVITIATGSDYEVFQAPLTSGNYS